MNRFVVYKNSINTRGRGNGAVDFFNDNIRSFSNKSDAIEFCNRSKQRANVGDYLYVVDTNKDPVTIYDIKV